MSLRLRCTALCCLLASLLALAPVRIAMAASTLTDCPADETALISDIADAGTGGTVRFGCDETITLASTISIGASVTLDGNGHAVKIDGNHAVGVFSVGGSTVTFTVKGLTVAHGSSASGGGIYNLGGTVIVMNSTLSGDSASLFGGGIFNQAGTLTVVNSTLSGNSAGLFGGGITNQSGTVTVTNSTLSGNSASLEGGGISDVGGTLMVTSSTLSGNSAAALGGGIDNEGGTATVTNSTLSGNSTTLAGSSGDGIFNQVGSSLTVTNSTLSGNSAIASGGGIFNLGTVSLTNTILANSPSGGNCSGLSAAADQGGNLDDGATCGFSTANHSLPSTNPLLGPLQDNGGPTQTMALLPGSPAINLGLAATCLLTGPTAVNDVDQRGLPRHALTRKACDSGAYDTGGTVASPLTVTGAVNVLFGAGWRLGFAGSTDPAFNVAYITFQQGSGSLVVRKPIALSCTNRCGGTVDEPLFGTSTVLLGGTVSSGRGRFATGDTVVVTLTVVTARGTGAVVATDTVTAVAVQVFAPGSATPVASVSANGPFQGQSAVQFVRLHQAPAP